jgi:hypothetical protein
MTKPVPAQNRDINSHAPNNMTILQKLDPGTRKSNLNALSKITAHT